MKSKAVSVFISAWVMLCLPFAATTAFADDDDDEKERGAGKGQLVNRIHYEFVGHLGELDDEGRLLVWQGSIEGDIEAEIRWWFVIPSTVPESMITDGRIAFYESRWEVRNGRKLLIAGESAGKTVFQFGGDGVWDGHGVVTHARGKYKRLKGRKIYESGPVLLGSTPPVTFSGTGMFLVY